MKPVIIYDGECGLCLCIRRTLEPLDLLHKMDWLPFQDPAALRYGIPREELETHVYLISGGRRWAGFDAVKQVLLRLPPFYAAVTLLAWRRPWALAPLALAFSPLFAPLGRAGYGLIARYRRLVPRTTCGRPV